VVVVHKQLLAVQVAHEEAVVVAVVVATQMLPLPLAQVVLVAMVT
jgi:hypothetical protein